MGEEVRTDEERMAEWEKGLPSLHDLPPLSIALIPPELISAFGIAPEPRRTLSDVNRASRETLSLLRGVGNISDAEDDDEIEDAEEEIDRDGSGSDSRKLRKIDCATEEADSAVRTETTLKRPRLVWTPQLHKRFVDVVAHLGIKNAVPKTIMQLMNVEGLTRENVASHLQKYRLYLKRMQGLSTDGPSSSDHLFASTPVPQSLRESPAAGAAGGHSHSHSNGHGNSHHSVPIQMPYPPPPPPPASHMMSMPLIGMPHPHHGHGHGHGHMGMPLPPLHSAAAAASSSYRSHHPYNMLHHRDWSHPHSHSHPQK